MACNAELRPGFRLDGAEDSDPALSSSVLRHLDVGRRRGAATGGTVPLVLELGRWWCVVKF